jgi:hypothetical protein
VHTLNLPLSFLRLSSFQNYDSYHIHFGLNSPSNVFSIYDYNIPIRENKLVWAANHINATGDYGSELVHTKMGTPIILTYNKKYKLVNTPIVVYYAGISTNKEDLYLEPIKEMAMNYNIKIAYPLIKGCKALDGSSIENKSLNEIKEVISCLSKTYNSKILIYALYDGANHILKLLQDDLLPLVTHCVLQVILIIRMGIMKNPAKEPVHQYIETHLKCQMLPYC